MKEMRNNQYEDSRIFAWVLVICLIVFAIVGFCIGFSSTGAVLDSNEFNKCEEIAGYIHEQPEDAKIQLPDGYSSEDVEDKIIVRKDNYAGHVEAIVRNGELTFKRVDGIYDQIINGIWGAIAALVIVAIICLIASFVSKHSDSK